MASVMFFVGLVDLKNDGGATRVGNIWIVRRYMISCYDCVSIDVSVVDMKSSICKIIGVESQAQQATFGEQMFKCALS